MGEIKVKKRINKYIIVLLLSLLVFCLITGLYYYVPSMRIFQSFENNSVNWRFATKAYIDEKILKIKKNEIYNKIIIAGIDDDAIESFGTFPFDRKVWASALNYLNSAPNMPSLVFFDIVFSDPSQNPKSDKALIDAFKNYKGVLGEDIILENIEGQNINELTGEEENIIEARKIKIIEQSLDYNSDRVQALKKIEIKLANNIQFSSMRFFPKVAPLMKELPGYLDFIGTANISFKENTYRLMPLILPVYYKIEQSDNSYILTNIYYPSIVLSMVLSQLKSDISNIIAEPGNVKIKNASYNGRISDFNIPVDENWQVNINYKSWPGSGYIHKISLKDISKAKLPKNSLVFIGMYSKKGSQDIWLSPLGDMYGVEHIGYALGTVLNRDFINNSPEWINIIDILLLTLLVGFITSRGSRLVALAAAFSILFPLFIGILLFQFNIIIITFIPILSSLLALISIQIFMLFTEEKDKMFIKSTFSSYLNPKLVDILIQNPDKIQLGGEDKEITVLFSAIKNLADISEKMNPKELIEFLNSYFSRMADIVMESSGTLDKYIGDSVMAFWGAPIDISDHTLKACEAALKMLQAVRDFNEEQSTKGHKPIIINIGINTGNIIVGNVGSERQKNYTAIGDSVNLASRLKGLNKFYHTEIVISEYSFEKIKGQIITRELDLTRVKGKLKPVRIYELLDINR